MAPSVQEQYEPVIGIEVHVQLSTQTKMFCGCKLSFGAPPNSLTCPVCQGQPGALPSPNKKALEYGIRVGSALNCKVSRTLQFDRKNYFYPDLPKGYQISQFDYPLNYDGEIELPLIEEATGLPKRIRIERAHLEEDAGKNIHMDNCSLVDFNRAGTPLIEIVSAPDMRSPEEAYLYLTILKRNLSYLKVSDLNLHKGSLRCDLNISLRPRGQEALPPYKVEIKNLNSFTGGRSALEYEIKRQSEILAQGKLPEIETRLWDEDRLETRTMRSKEKANDYRFFPDPDLPALQLDLAWVDKLRSDLPEMPDQRLARFIEEYKLPPKDACSLIDGGIALADFFEACVRCYNQPKKIVHWVQGEIARALNSRALDFEDLKLEPQDLADILLLLEDGKLNNITAKEVFAELLEKGGSPRDIAISQGKLIEDNDQEEEKIIEAVLEEFQKAVQEYQAGKEQAIGFLVGQCMRKLKGRANPKALPAKIQAKIKEQMGKS